MKDRWAIYSVLIPTVVLCDLLAKRWASSLYGGVKTILDGLFVIRVVHNRGVMFGFGEQADTGGTPLGVWLVFGVALVLLMGLALTTDPKKPMRHLGFACMIGGALGNGIDRLVHGFVTDYIHILFFPIINLADVSILMGMFFLIRSFSGEPHDLD